jgi:hypothetical protein
LARHLPYHLYLLVWLPFGHSWPIREWRSRCQKVAVMGSWYFALRRYGVLCELAVMHFKLKKAFCSASMNT